MNFYVEIVFPLPLDKPFHYSVPHTIKTVPLGSRVLAPFGPKKNLVGYVVGQTTEKPPFPTKDIVQLIDADPFIDKTGLQLARWLADRYLCSWGEALACIAPPALLPPKRPHEGGGVPQGSEPRPSALVLTAHQKAALAPIEEKLDARTFHSFLIRGVTDSGKTELYLRAMDKVLDQDRQALYLLPEIAMTPPFLDQLKDRYGANHVGLWHSGMSGGERRRTWDGARRGEIRVILGARSAVFAPFPRLGLIVLDEEHEPTYKQEERPRYHTRDVALKRGELAGAVVLMGSATPSIESYWKAKEGVYTLLELTSRVEERQLPPVDLIDRRGKSEAGTAKKASNFTVFSEPLKLAIEQRLARKEQILLFVNRRGFTPFLRCSKCGWVSRCPRCSTTMTVHLPSPSPLPKGEGEAKPGVRGMQCHACSKNEPFPVGCPSCKSMRLNQFGIGTQKVEEELKKQFPFVKAARLDRDVASQRKQHEKIYRAFASGDLDVLIGTQMIAKGFDFPRVTLVGVVDADVTLHLPDFRSAERTFDLLTQVAGRAGRGKTKGKVVVQTYHPDHDALIAAKDHDYLKFYVKEIEGRKLLSYPPFCRLVNIVLRTTKEEAARQAAEKLVEQLEKLDTEASLLGPAPAPYSRLRNQFRFQILLKGNDDSLKKTLAFLKSYRPAKAFMSVDVDPADLL